MKRPLFRKRNALVQGMPWLLPAAGVFGVLLVAGLLIRAFAPGLLVAAATPLWQGGTALTAGVGNIGSFFEDRATLVRERDQLLAEREAMLKGNAVLAAKAADLERLLGSRTENQGGILAGVLARPPVSPYDFLIVDAGSDAGVTAGARAFGPGGIPVGTVSEALKSSSRISLYSTPGQETEGWAGEGRVPLRLRGQGSGGFSAEVARDAGLKAGDQVFVPGPGALPIGTIASVPNDPSSPVVRIEIQPIENPFSLTWVTIGP